MEHSQVQKLALALPGVTEEPHHHKTSFRVRGKIFATADLSETCLNIMVGEAERDPVLDIYSHCLEALHWGKKIVGVRVNLLEATPEIVDELLKLAWREKAPLTLLSES